MLAVAPPSRFVVRRRQGVAVLAMALATLGLWAALFRGGESGIGASPQRGSGGVSEPIQALESGLTPAERIDQIMLLGFTGTDSAGPIFSELRSHQLGGLVVGAGNWRDRRQGAHLIAQLRGAGLADGRVPPLIVAQQEGGPYRAFPDLPPAMSELQIGNRGSSHVAEQWAQAGGEALRSAGVDLELFPVADVAPANSPLVERSFSDDPAVAARMTAAALRGCDHAGIACAPLHFPGLGAASQDTDQGPATVSLDAASLAKRDLSPFRAAFAEHAPAVVLSLAFYAAYDPVTPGALAPQVATNLLRRQVGYQGVALTDDLGAGATKAIYKVPAAAVAAVEAGADMVRIDSPADQAGVRAALLQAVKRGEIPEARLDEAAARVLELKRRLGLLKRSV